MSGPFKYENLSSNDHVVEEDDELSALASKREGVLSAVELAIEKEKQRRELEEDAENQRDAALLRGSVLKNKPLVKMDEFRAILEVEQELPPRDDPIWRDPIRTMALFHSYLGNRFPIDEAEKERSCVKQTGEIDAWQYVAFLPLLRVNELFVIAPTGSGKSWIMSQAATLFCTQEYLRKQGARLQISLDRPPRFVVYVIRGDKAKNQQAVEIVKNPAFQKMASLHFTEADLALFKEHQGGGRQAFKNNPVVDADYNAKKGIHKIVTFITYAQAGNVLKNDAHAFDNALLVVDEIHELQTAVEASGPRWAPSVRRFEEFLNKRMEKPIATRGMLLGLTATPFKSKEGFVRLMNYFCPEGIRPLEAEEFELDGIPEGIDLELAEDIAFCGYNLNNVLREIPITRFIGFRVAFYSIDLDENIYASWVGPPQEWRVAVTSDRSNEEIKWIRSVSGKDPRRYLSGAKLMSIRDKKEWSRSSLLYVGRQRAIALAVAEALAAVHAEEDEQGGVKKTMLFFPTQAGAATFVAFYEAIFDEVESAYKLIYLTNEDDAKEQKRKKSLFDVGGEGTLLVTNIKEYGTGITFTDRQLETSGMSRGPKRIIYVQPDTYTTAVQVEGRARRRCLHAGWKEAVSVERIVIVPFVDREGKELQTCYSTMKELTFLEAVFVLSIAPSIFNASYTKQAFWVRRPAQLLDVRMDDLEPIKNYNIADAKVPTVSSPWRRFLNFFF